MIYVITLMIMGAIAIFSVFYIFRDTPTHHKN